MHLMPLNSVFRHPRSFPFPGSPPHPCGTSVNPVSHTPPPHTQAHTSRRGAPGDRESVLPQVSRAPVTAAWTISADSPAQEDLALSWPQDAHILCPKALISGPGRGPSGVAVWQPRATPPGPSLTPWPRLAPLRALRSLGVASRLCSQSRVEWKMGPSLGLQRDGAGPLPTEGPLKWRPRLPVLGLR